MPELPEVETVRRDLAPLVVGRRIDEAAVTHPRVVRRYPSPAEVVARVEGRTVAGVDRHGKYLLVRLDSGDVLVVHLGMSGQLLWVHQGAGRAAPKHTHARLRFGSDELRYVDPRTFGELFVTGADLGALAHVGPDAHTGVASPAALGRLLRRRRRRLKELLMDQGFIAGLGNIYSDEVLHLAGLAHARRSDTLTDAEVRRLHGAVRAVLDDAIAHRGSSLADEQYRDVFGRVGRYRERHRVYDRAGEPCTRCGAPITRVKAGGRGTFFCGACQR